MIVPLKSVEKQFLLLALIFQVALISATWPLWAGVASFPAVPLVSWLTSVPFLVDRCLLTLLLASITMAIFCLCQREGIPQNDRSMPPIEGLSNQQSTANERVLLWCLSASLVASLALGFLNQHRLQAWHWLFVLIVAQRLLIGGADRRWTFQITMAVIYVFAALSRLSPLVAEGMSRELVVFVFRKLSLEHLLRSESIVFGACVAMSVFEMVVGLLLLCRPARQAGIAASMTLHLSLLMLLGPIGLDHQAGVLTWNLFFLCAVPVLFRKSVDSDLPVSVEQTNESRRSFWIRLTVASALIGFPVSGYFGFADNWLSWQLYSPRPEVVYVHVHQDHADRLPAAAQRFLQPPKPLDEWCLLRIDRWSLAATGAPVYPEDRFQLGVAEYLQNQVEANAIRVGLEEPDIPRWWHRHSTELSGADGLSRRLDRHFFQGTYRWP